MHENPLSQRSLGIRLQPVNLVAAAGVRGSLMKAHAPQADPKVAQWVLTSRADGMPVHTVRDGLIAAGWDRALATVYAETPAQSLLQLVLDASAAGNVATQPPPAATAPTTSPAKAQQHAVPRTVIAPSMSTVQILGRSIGVRTLHQAPHIIALEGFLSSDECDALVEVARGKLKRSATQDGHSGLETVHDSRTSSGCFLTRGMNDLVRSIESRIAALCDWPLENGEALQILHYGPGAEYKPHYDYFDPDQPGNQAVLRRGGQRVATLVMYLNTPDAGGATSFPDVDLSVAAVKGNAVFFSYPVATPASLSLHGGSPVIAGEKWVATKWMRQSRFD